MAAPEKSAEEVNQVIIPDKQGFFIKGSCGDCPHYHACPRMKGGECENPVVEWVLL